MALPVETPRVIYTGSGTRGPFSLSVGGTAFTYAEASHIRATRFNDENEPTVLTNGVHYQLSASEVLPDVGEETQTVTAATLTLELSQDVLAADEHLLIERITPASQDLILTTGGGFSSANAERQFDFVMRHIQEIRAILARAILINALDTAGALEIPLEADRASKWFTFDADGNPTATTLDEALQGEQGDPGDAGTVWYTGSGAPSSGVGTSVDRYLNTSNGDVYTKASGSWVLDGNIRGASGAGTGDMLKTDNLSGLASVAAARSNLGLDSAALLAAAAVFQVANNLSEGNAATMRTNLGLGSAALLAATAVLQAANNLSDLANAATARTNLGLGTMAVLAEMSTAQFWANTADKGVSTDQLWAAAAIQALTDGATITPDFGAGINFTVTLGGNRVLGLPTNLKQGQCGVIYVVQDGTGSRGLTYNAAYKWAGGTAGVLSTGAGKVDRLGYIVRSSTDGSEFIELSLVKDIR